MESPEITHQTIAPFTFASKCRPKDDKWSAFVHRVTRKFSASATKLTTIEEAVLGPSLPVKLTLDYSGAAITIYLFPSGVGVSKVEWPLYKSGRSETIEEILNTRRQRHQDLLQATGAIGARLLSVVSLARKHAKSENGFPREIFLQQSCCPYVFSFYILRSTTKEEGEAADRIARALLRPSSKGWGDDLAEARTTKEIEDTNSGKESITTNWDLRNDVHCHMSWASVVGICKNNSQDLAQLYSALECRLQAAWCLAHSIGCIQGNQHRLSGYEVELVAATLESGIRDLAALKDPTMSERVKRLYEGMLVTSGLEETILAAKEQVSALRIISAARSIRQRASFELAAEFFLVLLVCLQLVPLVEKVPLEGSARDSLATIIAVIAALYVVVRLLFRR